MSQTSQSHCFTAPGDPEDGDPERITIFGPDFPFPYDSWLASPKGIGTIPAEKHGAEVAIIGAGLSGMVAAYELMNLGLRPVIYESARMGGRLRSEQFSSGDEAVAELGGMRFPESSSTFFHYVQKLGLDTKAFPNPLTPAADSTVIDLAGKTWFAQSVDDLPALFREVAEAWDAALEDGFGFSDLQEAIRGRDVPRLKALWNDIVRRWDDHSFYEFVATSDAFSRLSFRHREVFGQVGFGTGGWDSDFANTMLEILRVVITNCDSDQHLIRGGAEQVPRQLWELETGPDSPWPEGTSLRSLHQGRTRSAARSLRRRADGSIRVTEAYGPGGDYDAVLVTCQSWLLTTHIDCEEALFSQDMWMALDRTRYMQSAKTFVLVDRPFWKDLDPQTGRPAMSMTLTDRMTRGTYLFDDGPDQPAVMCLSYSWMSDALKMLSHSAPERTRLALEALAQIYPNVDIESHIIAEPISVSWEADPNFLGAFKGALPGHYRYNERMYSHFYQQSMPDSHRGIFLAGDDISFTPAWAEGAVQTGLNALWGIMTHFGGTSHPQNPGPGDVYDQLRPLRLED
ncbi:flavin monoamine oxidase family protein [Garicola koreensis]|uniref:Tryptophan 2-monooxygenase n=1 Tax=Garicola koreensis TaxID=1262554 RepID=A0A7W5XLA9_9MICC|nr:NAD(P)/FAD-dependent oxidoreductase [Garicola koreensis]MBB3667910.1 tryptophan 2-monooxygenase [Garicola koreensis]